MSLSVGFNNLLIRLFQQCNVHLHLVVCSGFGLFDGFMLYLIIANVVLKLVVASQKIDFTTFNVYKEINDDVFTSVVWTLNPLLT